MSRQTLSVVLLLLAGCEVVSWEIANEDLDHGVPVLRVSIDSHAATNDLRLRLMVDDDVPWRDLRFAILACGGRKETSGPVRYIERFWIDGVNSPQPGVEEIEANESPELLFDGDSATAGERE